MEKVKRQVYKLQHQKGCLTKELTEMKKKEKCVNDKIPPKHDIARLIEDLLFYFLGVFT